MPATAEHGGSKRRGGIWATTQKGRRKIRTDSKPAGMRPTDGFAFVPLNLTVPLIPHHTASAGLSNWLSVPRRG
jgi:hypothetical protein